MNMELEMTSIQYEEFCRFFLAEKFSIPIEEVKSRTIPSPTSPDLPQYSHQIDLYWEDGNELTKYINIANAKWRRSEKVDQDDVMLLQQVKEELHANKAMMITSIGFTKGAENVARNKNIALHVVRPTFDYSRLHRKDRKIIKTELQELSTNSNLNYSHSVVHRAFDVETSTEVESPTVVKEIVSSNRLNRMSQSHSTRVTPSNTTTTSGRQGQTHRGFTRSTSGGANRGR